MASVSGIVITRNEERHISDCLGTLTWADEIVVVDSQSTDRTVARARRFTERVHDLPFVNFARTRNAALDLARCDWAFFLDADERVSDALATEVRDCISSPEPHSGYWVPRRNFILGRWMGHTGWYPDYQLRLFQRSRGRYDEAREVHEVVLLDGSAGRLAQAILHYNYESLGEVFSRQRRYASLQAATLRRAGRRAQPHNLVLQPLRELRRRYVTLRGYRDGVHGLFLSLVMAYYEFLVYAKLARLSVRRA